MRALHWLADRLKDLFYDPTNTHLDPGRVAGWVTIVSVVGATVWNVHLGQPIDLGVGGLPGGLASLLGAAVIYLIQDRKRSGV